MESSKVTKRISTEFLMMVSTPVASAGMDIKMNLQFDTPNCEFGDVTMGIDFGVQSTSTVINNVLGALVNTFDVNEKVKAENGNRLEIDLLDILPDAASSVLERAFSADVNIVTLLDEMYEDGATITLELNPTFKPSTSIYVRTFDFGKSLNVVDLAADTIGAANLPSNIVQCRSSAMSGKMCLLLGSDAAKCVPSKKSGLAPGAIAGIVVGILILAIGIITLVMWKRNACCFARRAIRVIPGTAPATATPPPIVVVSQPVPQANQMAKSPQSPQVIYQQPIQTSMTTTTSAPAVEYAGQPKTSG